jgi:hypothetical protein
MWCSKNISLSYELLGHILDLWGSQNRKTAEMSCWNLSPLNEPMFKNQSVKMLKMLIIVKK